MNGHNYQGEEIKVEFAGARKKGGRGGDRGGRDGGGGLATSGSSSPRRRHLTERTADNITNHRKHEGTRVFSTTAQWSR